jgi:hypothetical protein
LTSKIFEINNIDNQESLKYLATGDSLKFFIGSLSRFFPDQFLLGATPPLANSFKINGNSKKIDALNSRYLPFWNK